jgi:hypothetical protein
VPLNRKFIGDGPVAAEIIRLGLTDSGTREAASCSQDSDKSIVANAMTAQSGRSGWHIQRNVHFRTFSGYVSFILKKLSGTYP